MNNKPDNKPDRLRKAAVLVAALDRETAEAMLDRLAPEHAQAIRHAVVELGDVDPRERRAVLEEFRKLGPVKPRNASRGIALDGPLAGRLASCTYAEADAHSDESPTQEKPFRFLHETDSRKLAHILARERPQTIALIVAHLPRDRAGEVLAALSSPLQIEVVRRLVDLDDTDPAILRDVERGLETRLAEQLRSQRRRRTGLATMTGILDAAQGNVGAKILDNVASYDGNLAGKLGYDRLEFEDLDRLGDDDLARLFASAEPEIALMALTGAPPELIDRITRQLPPREAAVLTRRLDHPQPIRLSDVEEARREIAELANRLAIEGTVRPRTDSRRQLLNASV
ncbi:MAG: hypothetical protein HQ581_28735 [Planctomycetes bacterium]|nr:hypothetical protein [Planctomycetota bacterium]